MKPETHEEPQAAVGSGDGLGGGPGAGTIMLRCPTCGRTVETPRHESDPTAAVLVVTGCDLPRCDLNGGWESPFYYKADGSEMTPAELIQDDGTRPPSTEALPTPGDGATTD